MIRFRTLTGCLLALMPTMFSAVMAIADDEFPPTTRVEQGFAREISGIVTAEEGILTPGSVQVFAQFASLYTPLDHIYTQDFTEALSGLSGDYKIDALDDRRLLCVAKTFAPQSVKVPTGNRLDVVLKKGRSISGTILSPDGDPVSGAHVKLVNWFIPKAVDKSNEWGQDNGTHINDVANLPDFGNATKVETDKDGHFAINNLPEEYRVGLSVHAAGLGEQVIWVRSLIDGKFDSRPKDFPKQILVENEFSHQLEKSSILQLTAIEDESGTPAKIRSVTIARVLNANDDGNYRYARTTKVNDSVASICLRQYHFHGFEIWIEPEENDRLTCCRLKFPVNPDAKSFEAEVRFKEGTLVRGIVRDEFTDEPISNVPMLWRNSDGKRASTEGHGTGLQQTTNEGGLFEFAVPKTDGVLGIAGNVPGYQSDFGWNRRTQYERFAPELLERFTRSIDSDAETIAPFEFFLKPSYELKIKTQLSDSPVADCTVTGIFPEPYPFEGNSYSSKRHVTTTDHEGSGKLEHWYYDSLQLAISGKDLQSDDSQPAPRDQRPPSQLYPTRLLAFSENGILQGTTMVPLPAPDSESKEIEVPIEMQISGRVSGKVVDLDKQPVKGIWVQASLDNFGRGLSWWTRTRDDGQFLLTGLPIGMPLNWRVDPSSAKTSKSHGKFIVDLSNLKSGDVLEIDPIVVLNLTELAKPLADIELKGLKNSDALQKLAQYAKDNFAKLPERKEANQAYFRNVSSQDASPLFAKKLEKKLETLVIELADRNPGGEFELQVLDTASLWFYDPRNVKGVMTYAGRSINQKCHNRLMQNHLENENAQDALVRLTMELTKHQFENRNQLWTELREQSPLKRTKSIASIHSLNWANSKAIGSLHQNVSSQKFEAEFTELEKCVDAILDYPSKVDEISTYVRKYEIEKLDKMLDYYSKMSIEKPETAVTERIEKIADLVAPLLNGS